MSGADAPAGWSDVCVAPPDWWGFLLCRGRRWGQEVGLGAVIIAEAGALDSRPWGGRHYRMLSPSQKVVKLVKLVKGCRLEGSPGAGIGVVATAMGARTTEQTMDREELAAWVRSEARKRG
jgi:hypothetical protein